MKKTITRIVKHPLFTGSFVMIFGNLIVNVVSYIYHLIIGRMLGPVDYGTLISLFSILYIVGIIPQSTSFAITKFISSAVSRAEVKTIYQIINKFVFIFALLASFSVFLSSCLITNFLRMNEVWLVLLIAPILFAILITLVNQATSQGLLKFSGVVIPSFVSNLGKLVFGVGLVMLGFRVTGAMIAILIGAFLSYFSSVSFIKPILKEKAAISDFTLKKFFVFALPVLLQALAFTSFFTVDLILVKHFFAPFEAGLYAALSTLGKIIYFASSPITATMFPIVSRKKARGENYQQVFLLAFGATLVLSLGVVMVFYLFPNIVIGVLYGSQYLKAAPELVSMGAFMLFYSLDYILINFLLSIGITRVVILPLVASVSQAVGIWLWHDSLSQVISISLWIMIGLFIGLGGYLGYNRIEKKRVKDENKTAIVGDYSRL